MRAKTTLRILLFGVTLAAVGALFWQYQTGWLGEGTPSLMAEEAKVPACTNQDVLDKLKYNLFTVVKQQALTAHPDNEVAKKWSASIENIRQLSKGDGERVCKADLIYDSLPTLYGLEVPASIPVRQAGCIWQNMTLDGHATASLIYKMETLLDKPDQIHYEWMCMH